MIKLTKIKFFIFSYHFVDVNKMIKFRKTACRASFFCAFYAFFKISPFCIFKGRLQLPCIPEFSSIFVGVLDILERLLRISDNFFFSHRASCVCCFY